MSWVFTIVVVGGYVAYTVVNSIQAKRQDLAHDSLNLVLVRGGVLAVAAIAVTLFANQNRNVNPSKAIWHPLGGDRPSC